MVKTSFKTISGILSASLILTGCLKDELPVKPHDPGNVIEATVNMEQDYKWQIYYDLESNSIVGKNLKTAWDLGLATGADDYHIVLNSAKMMYAYNTGKTDMAAVTIEDTVGRQRYDAPSGNPDSTAIGDWRDKGAVYIIDLGINSAGVHQGFVKVKFGKTDATAYSLDFIPMDGGTVETITVTKDSSYNLAFVSFAEKKQMTIEPPKATWDIVFTQYTHRFTDPPMPYLVTGCLLNRYNTYAAVDSTTAFTDISFDKTAEYTLSSALNIIGYDWKAYTGSTYVTYPNINYIIRSRNGIYYKLHFTDFLNNGVNGNPKWEYQKL